MIFVVQEERALRALFFLNDEVLSRPVTEEHLETLADLAALVVHEMGLRLAVRLDPAD